MTTIVSVDQLCTAAERLLVDRLPAVLEHPSVLELVGDDVAHYGQNKISDWQQVPTIEALSKAKLPAGAIASAGLVEPPRYSRAKYAWETTWRIAVGVYVRGRDHDNTQARVRNWLAITRLALRTDPSLGGIATGLEWAGEEHRLLPNRNQARTIAAGALAINVSADMVGELTPTDGTWPPVTSTHPTLSVQQ